MLVLADSAATSLGRLGCMAAVAMLGGVRCARRRSNWTTPTLEETYGDILDHLDEPRHQPREQGQKHQDDDPAHAEEVEVFDRRAQDDECGHRDDEVRSQQMQLVLLAQAFQSVFILLGLRTPRLLRHTLIGRARLRHVRLLRRRHRVEALSYNMRVSVRVSSGARPRPSARSALLRRGLTRLVVRGSGRLRRLGDRLGDGHRRALNQGNRTIVSVVLLGRDEEQRWIADRLRQARAGSSSLLVLVGEPGIGKSTLLDWARDQAADMTVLGALGVESESGWRGPVSTSWSFPCAECSTCFRKPRPTRSE